MAEITIESFSESLKKSSPLFGLVESSFTKKWAARKLFKLIMTPFTDLPSFKAGLIDHNGKLLVSPRDMTPSQRRCFGPFERSAIKLKRILARSSSSATVLALSYLETKQYDDFDALVMGLADTQKVADTVDGQDVPEPEPVEEETVTANVANVEKPLKMLKKLEKRD